MGLELSNNNLGGNLSSRIGILKVLSQLYLSHNQFTGSIPSLIDGCQSLEILLLSNNKFEGSIPQSLGNIRGLIVLDLSNNNLSGSIPKSLQDLPFLTRFNVSYNSLGGEIPNLNFTADSFLHNSADLCGAKQFGVPPCIQSDKGSKNILRLAKYVVPPIVSALILVIVVLALLRKGASKQIPSSSDAVLAGISWTRVSYRELQLGTNNFSESNLLGRGSFGSVFKGTLSNELNVAVKVFNLELEGALKSFETEGVILSSVRHRNLVRIIGCCSNEEFKALILDYVPNGSLERWLYSDNIRLDFVQSLKVAVDVGLALEYLHHGHTFPVVHCDIKPSNVLIDEDMTARVSDFGIAKLFDEGEVVVQTKTFATVGYAAPGNNNIPLFTIVFNIVLGKNSPNPLVLF